MLHKITLNNKENDEKTYYFNQKKFSFIFTLRIYIGHYLLQVQTIIARRRFSQARGCLQLRAEIIGDGGLAVANGRGQDGISGFARLIVAPRGSYRRR